MVSGVVKRHTSSYALGIFHMITSIIRASHNKSINNVLQCGLGVEGSNSVRRATWGTQSHSKYNCSRYIRPLIE